MANQIEDVNDQTLQIRELEEENAKLREERAALQHNFRIQLCDHIGPPLAQHMASEQMLQLVTENATLKESIAALKGELASVGQESEQFVTVKPELTNGMDEHLVIIKSDLRIIKAKMFRDDALRVQAHC